MINFSLLCIQGRLITGLSFQSSIAIEFNKLPKSKQKKPKDEQKQVILLCIYVYNMVSLVMIE